MTTGEMVSVAIALGLTLILLYRLGPIARRIGLVDVPATRETDDGAVPLTGGLAMFFGFTIAVLTLPVDLAPLRPFFAAGAILVLVGLLDDLHELSSRARFAAQILAATVMVWWGQVALFDLGYIGAEGRLLRLDGFEVVFSVFCAVGVINALNMIDGMDGLAASLSLVPLLALAGLAHRAGASSERDVLILLAAACVAFLCFNLRLPGRTRALAFMGDAGSMFLGLAIAWFVIKLSQGPERVMAPVTALWLLLVPLFDTVWLLFKRPLTGRLPTAADREHVHHVLQMTGVGVSRSLLVLVAASALAAGIGIGAELAGVSERFMLLAFLALFCGYCALMVAAASRQRFAFWRVDRRHRGDDRRGTADRRCRVRRAAGERRGGDERRGPMGADRG